MLSKTQRRARAERRRMVNYVHEQLRLPQSPMYRMLQREPHPVPNWAGATMLDWVAHEMDGPWNRQVKAARLVRKLMKIRMTC